MTRLFGWRCLENKVKKRFCKFVCHTVDSSTPLHPSDTCQLPVWENSQEKWWKDKNNCTLKVRRLDRWTCIACIQLVGHHYFCGQGGLLLCWCHRGWGGGVTGCSKRTVFVHVSPLPWLQCAPRFKVWAVSTMRVSKPTFLFFILWLNFWGWFPWQWSEKPFFWASWCKCKNESYFVSFGKYFSFAEILLSLLVEICFENLRTSN